MSRKFFGLMAIAGMAIATGLGGATQNAEAGLFSRMFGGGHHGSCGSCDYAACGHDSCGYVGHYEYDDDDACGHHHKHSHHGHGCYSSCGPVYAAPVSSCSSCSTATCCSAPVSHCGSACGQISHCGHTSGCSSCGSPCGSACGGYATSVSYGGCSSCGTVSGGCPGGNCGVTYSASPMPMESGAPYNAAPAPPQGEEAPAPPAEDSLPPADNGAEEPAA